MFKFFNKNIIENNVTMQAGEVAFKTGIPKSAEGDFVKALILAVFSSVITNLHLVVEMNNEHTEKLQKMDSLQIQHLILLEVAWIYSQFWNMEGFFDSFKMKTETINQYIIIAFQKLGSDAKKEIDKFVSLKNDPSESLNYYKNSFFELLHIDDFASCMAFGLYKAKISKDLGGILPLVIQNFKEME